MVNHVGGTMPDTRKEKLVLAMEALKNAKKDMTPEELRDYLNEQLRSTPPSSRMAIPVPSDVEEVAPPVYEENDTRLQAVPLPQIGAVKGGATPLPYDVSQKGKVKKLPFITGKKSKLYEMMQ